MSLAAAYLTDPFLIHSLTEGLAATFKAIVIFSKQTGGVPGLSGGRGR